MGYHHGDLRSALILAGVELIAEKGFAGLSVAEAARRTGVSAAAPYRHFANRDAFLLAIATEAGVVMGDQLEVALGDADDPLDQIEAIADTYVRFVIAHKVGFDLIFAAELRESDDGELRAAGRRVIDLMMRPGIEVSPDMARALELNEELWTTAHGYAALFLTGFYGPSADYVVTAARRTARRLGMAASGTVRTLQA
jgi:AcrR family transcriptional regulator